MPLHLEAAFFSGAALCDRIFSFSPQESLWRLGCHGDILSPGTHYALTRRRTPLASPRLHPCDGPSCRYSECGGVVGRTHSRIHLSPLEDHNGLFSCQVGELFSDSYLEASFAYFPITPVDAYFTTISPSEPHLSL